MGHLGGSRCSLCKGDMDLFKVLVLFGAFFVATYSIIFGILSNNSEVLSVFIVLYNQNHYVLVVRHKLFHEPKLETLDSLSKKSLFPLSPSQVTCYLLPAPTDSPILDTACSWHCWVPTLLWQERFLRMMLIGSVAGIQVSFVGMAGSYFIVWTGHLSPTFFYLRFF